MAPLGSVLALRVIGAQEGRCRVQDLSGGLRLTVGAASKLVDRLEAAELVARSPNPGDRRSSFVTLTASGRDALLSGTAILDAALAEHLSGQPEVDRVVATLNRLVASLPTDSIGDPR